MISFQGNANQNTIRYLTLVTVAFRIITKEVTNLDEGIVKKEDFTIPT